MTARAILRVALTAADAPRLQLLRAAKRGSEPSMEALSEKPWERLYCIP